MHWESAEGRLINHGRTIMTSDQIVLRRERIDKQRGYRAYIPNAPAASALRRRTRTLLRLDDGRCGWFIVTDRQAALLCLRSEGAFR